MTDDAGASADPRTPAIVARLRAAGCVFAEEEAAILLEDAGRADDAVAASRLEERIVRRVAGEPLEYIVGWSEFRGLRIAVAPGVFVPRQRTTLLVREVLRVAPPAPVVLDLCCGAGAIGAAVLDERPDATVHAADIDPAATECARRTLSSVDAGRSAGRTGAQRFTVSTGDLYAPLPDALRGSIDVIVANAPYVPTDEIRLMPPEARDHEARAALDGGADGLDLQRRIAQDARAWLAPGGHVVIETSRLQASATTGILQAVGFSVSIVRDDEVAGTAAVASLPR